MKKKIIVFLGIIGVFLFSILQYIKPPVKTKAVGKYNDPQYVTLILDEGDKGYISVNNVYNYIFTLGVGENDGFYFLDYYQTGSDDNESLTFYGFNGLDDNNTARVWVKVIWKDANYPSGKEIDRFIIDTDFYLYTWFYKWRVNSTGFSMNVSYHVGAIPNNSDNYYEFPKGTAGYDRVQYIDTSFAYIKNNNNGYTNFTQQKQEMFNLFTDDLGSYVDDWLSWEIYTRLEEEHDEGYNVGYEDGYPVGYQEGKDDGIDEGFQLGYDEGFEDGQDDGIDIGIPIGYNQGIAKNLSSNWLTQTFTSITNIFKIEIFPGFKIGFLLAIPLVFMLLRIIINIWRA